MCLLNYFIVILTFTAFVACDYLIETGCNNVTTQQNFNISQYMGLWYEIKKYQPTSIKQARCVTARYSNLKNGTFDVDNSMLLYRHNISIAGHGFEVNPRAKDGKLSVSLPDADSYNMTYYILGTDYQNYSVIWSCMNETADISIQHVWVLSRTPNITASNEVKVNQIITNNHFNLSKFTYVNQTSCHGRQKNSAQKLQTNAVIAIFLALVILKVFL